MEPRWYQVEARDRVLEALGDNQSALISAPTGSGKSLIASMLSRAVVDEDDSARVFILAHRSHLVEQNANAVRALGVDCSIYSAELDKKELGARVVSASIQSIARQAIPHPTLAIIDEAHMLSDEDDTLYRKFLARTQPTRMVGMTATPFRLKGGLIYGDDKLFRDVTYAIPMKRLIEEGYLCPLIARDPQECIELTGLRIVGGDYSMSEVDPRVRKICKRSLPEILKLTEQRRSILFFMSSVELCGYMAERLCENGVEAVAVTGETPTLPTLDALKRFREGTLRAIVSVDKFTTGFDAPNVDAIVCLRPTKSTALWVQMCGRGSRVHPSKENCLILDYGLNAWNHGPIDEVVVTEKHGKATFHPPPQKTCPECRTLLLLSATACSCGHHFPRQARGAGVEETASAAPIITTGEPCWIPVYSSDYEPHHKEGKPQSIKITYHTPVGRIMSWVCPEHKGFAGQKARQWQQRRALPPTGVVATLRNIADAHERVKLKRILAKKKDKYWDVIQEDVEFADTPLADFSALLTVDVK
jgi:DNA repair protein RadD